MAINKLDYPLSRMQQRIMQSKNHVYNLYYVWYEIPMFIIIVYQIPCFTQNKSLFCFRNKWWIFSSSSWHGWIWRWRWYVKLVVV